MSPWKRIVPQVVGSAASTVALAAVARSRGATCLAVAPAGWGPTQLTDAVVAVVCATACLVSLWHLASCLILLAAVRPDARRARTLVLGWGTPWARRIVTGALVAGLGAAPAWSAPTPAAPVEAGTGLTVSATAPSGHAVTDRAEAVLTGPLTGPLTESAASQAAVSPADPGSDTAPAPSEDLGWTPTPSDATAPGAGASGDAPQDTQPAPADGTAGPRDADVPAPGDGTVTVRAGDSLWSLTAALLGPGASDAEVALAWPTLYAANASTIGADPSVIHPSTVLAVPAGLVAVPAP